MAGSSDARIAEIEIKLSFNEDLLDELNRTVARQQQRIDDLEHLVRDLRLQLQRSLPADPGDSAHDIPPHY
jgi:SlyX protein